MLRSNHMELRKVNVGGGGVESKDQDQLCWRFERAELVNTNLKLYIYIEAPEGWGYGYLNK